MEYKFEFTEELYDSNYCQIIDLLNSHYLKILNFRNEGIRRGFGVYVKNEVNDLIGGLVGYSELDWLFLDSLYICDNYRKKGLASNLMLLAEKLAKNRSCIGLKLECFKDNLEFYLKKDYKIYYTEDFNINNPTYYLKKNI